MPKLDTGNKKEAVTGNILYVEVNGFAPDVMLVHR